MISRASRIDDLLADLVEFLLAGEVPVNSKLGGEAKSGNGRQSMVTRIGTEPGKINGG